MSARQVEATPRRLEQHVPPLGNRLAPARKVELARSLLPPLQRLQERLGERPPQPERLADRAHLRTEARVGDAELGEIEARRLDDDVVERRFEGRGGLAGDVVRKLVERVADGEQGRELGDREAGRLRGERRRARDARVHLDREQLAGLGLVGELHIGSAGREADAAGARERGLTEALVLGIGQGLLRRDRRRVARVHSHQIEVLDRADDHAVAGSVGHHLQLVLLPAFERALDEHRADRARVEPAANESLQLGPVVRDASARAAERERRPDDGGRLQAVELVRRGDDAALRHGYSGLAERRAEGEPVLGTADRVHVGADQLDPELVQNTRVTELDGDVERRLAAQRRQQRVRPLAFDHLGDGLGVQRLEVGRVGPLGVGHNRGRVRVDEDDAEPLAPQHPARLRPRVVELACLPDANRARADDQDRAKIGSLRHVLAIRSKKGRASSGPGAASGWNCTVANPSPAKPSTVPSLSETCVTSTSPESATAKPWFWTVTSTRPLRSSRTGWLAPRCPNGSLNVSSPSASPSSWWPRQMPKSGTWPSSSRTVSIGPSSTAGSPGPFETSTARGSVSRTASSSHEPGTTTTSSPHSARRRGIERFVPRSTTVMRGPVPSRYGSRVPTLRSRGRPSIGGSARARAYSSSTGASPSAQRRTPPSRIRRTRARVSTSSSATTPCDASHCAHAGRALRMTIPSACTRSDSSRVPSRP